ncbi:MAG: YqaJ viral recombinase family protein [Aerococcus sp.]|nr:YqaJ viral recombinase family protein [Aerococcus sp.]
MFGLEKEDPNVTQNRQRYVGGSDVPTILGINPYRTQYELAREKIGLTERTFEGNEYTQFGNVLEPQIRDYINAIYDKKFVVDTYIDEERHIRSNVDGIDRELELLLEIKTHGKHYHQNIYEAQMQLYMWQTGCQKGWLALYQRPEDFNTDFESGRLELKEIPRDEEQIQRILAAIETFWIRCEYLKETPKMGEKAYMTNGTEMQIYAAKLERATPHLLEMKRATKAYEEEYEAWKKKLYEVMAENNIKKFETPTFIITQVLPSKGSRFDSKRFKAEHGDLYQDYQTPTERKGYVKITERKRSHANLT